MAKDPWCVYKDGGWLAIDCRDGNPSLLSVNLVSSGFIQFVVRLVVYKPVAMTFNLEQTAERNYVGRESSYSLIIKV